MAKKRFYVTTAIDYVNARPHIGHAFEKVLADALARWKKQKGCEVFFLTGVDENAQKNVQAAEEEGISTKKLVDKYSAKFQALKDVLNLSFDDFIRTTEKKHILGSQKIWQDCKKDIYKKIVKDVEKWISKVILHNLKLFSSL